MMRAHALHLAASWGSRRVASSARRGRRVAARVRRPRTRPLGSAGRQRVVFASLAALLLATGCDEGRPTRGARPLERARPPSGPYQPTTVVGGGSISGRVTWVGALPEPVPAPGGMDPEICGEAAHVPVLTIGARGGVAGTVIVLDGIATGRPLEIPSEPAVLRAAGCRFEPHVLALGRGTRLRVENADPIMHDARATDGRGALRFDIGLPTAGAASELVLDEPGVLRVVDDAGHPGMLAWVHVIEHPYFAVTDRDGRFRIPTIPPGTYAVRVWHEGVRAGEGGAPSAPMLLSRTVTVLSGNDTALDFELDRAAAEAAGD